MKEIRRCTVPTLEVLLYVVRSNSIALTTSLVARAGSITCLGPTPITARTRANALI